MLTNFVNIFTSPKYINCYIRGKNINDNVIDCDR